VASPRLLAAAARGMRGTANEWNRIYLPACGATLPFAKAPVRRPAWLLAGAGGGLSLFALMALSLISAEPSGLSYSGDPESQKQAARSPNLPSPPVHPPPRTAVFTWLRSQISGRSLQWQKVLDVGSGFNSLSWLVNATCAHVTAIVASKQTAAELHYAIQQGRFERPTSCTNAQGTEPSVEIQVGDWADPTFLGGGDWDAILADQLLGEVRLQSQWPAVARLASSVRRGGMLLVVGQEPAERSAPVERMRQAMFLLAGRKSDYVECPQALVAWELNRSGLVIEGSSRFQDTGPQAHEVALTTRMAAQEASASPASQMGPGVAQAVARLANEITKAENTSNAVRGTLGWKYAISARRP